MDDLSVYLFDMKRLGQNITLLFLLASLLGLPLVANARVGMKQPLPPCNMSMTGQGTERSMGEHCKTTVCKHCVTCDLCAHCFASVTASQGISVVPVRAGWHFDSYISSFISIHPPVDSPPPRLA